jgi:hypothetical protein
MYDMYSECSLYRRSGCGILSLMEGIKHDHKIHDIGLQWCRVMADSVATTPIPF